MLILYTQASEIERRIAAENLHAYWQRRGLPHDLAWAKDYLRIGHGKDVVSDQFFIYRTRDFAGLVALVEQEGGVAEIREEIVFVREASFCAMITELIHYAREKRLRKVFSCALAERVSHYTSLGFVPEGVLRSHFKEGEDLTIMSKFL
jgi:hypothetical protein